MRRRTAALGSILLRTLHEGAFPSPCALAYPRQGRRSLDECQGCWPTGHLGGVNVADLRRPRSAATAACGAALALSLNACGAGKVPSAGRIPVDHRPSAVACPLERGAGDPIVYGVSCPLEDGGRCSLGASLSDGGVCPCFQNCSADVDCTQGANGRCENRFPPVGTECSYDQCFADDDCDAGVPCICRPSSADNGANVCATQALAGSMPIAGRKAIVLRVLRGNSPRATECR